MLLLAKDAFCSGSGSKRTACVHSLQVQCYPTQQNHSVTDLVLFVLALDESSTKLSKTIGISNQKSDSFTRFR